ncbi:hypothetical protein [Mastigocoleus testarum]|uniref:Uncharacterized protein n=1 Tax=Mastigocoleus testarum BC008 TaxID=371196 RepID=A0A0V7ZHQ7_9CYAN|nr:hypothetical protein [Mastigocoleus testarum]KST64078.1 hypothetical protein BC008_40505 [Mastigocoleus testarum BC008]KST64788.1 hypothetical protein BC008_41480 [Mastigocoleus testarum BC008]
MTSNTYNRSRNFAFKINSSSSSNIIPVLGNNLDGLSGINSGILSANLFLKNLKIFSSIKSLPEIQLPNIEFDDSETEKLYKTLDVEWKSPRKQIQLLSNDGINGWIVIAEISLLNPSGYPYRIYNAMDYLTDNLTYEFGENGRLGIKLIDVGYGLLEGDDELTIHGSYVQEIVYENEWAGSGNVITNNIETSVNVTTNSFIILSSNNFRKYVLISNQGFNDCYIKFGEDVDVNSAIKIVPGGHYEYSTSNVNWRGNISAICKNGTSKLNILESI